MGIFRAYIWVFRTYLSSLCPYLSSLYPYLSILYPYLSSLYPGGQPWGPLEAEGRPVGWGKKLRNTLKFWCYSKIIWSIFS